MNKLSRPKVKKQQFECHKLVAALRVCKRCAAPGPIQAPNLTDCMGRHNTRNNYYRQTASFY